MSLNKALRLARQPSGSTFRKEKGKNTCQREEGPKKILALGPGQRAQGGTRVREIRPFPNLVKLPSSTVFVVM